MDRNPILCLAALGSEDWCDVIHAGVFSGGRPSVHGVAPKGPTRGVRARKRALHVCGSTYFYCYVIFLEIEQHKPRIGQGAKRVRLASLDREARRNDPWNCDSRFPPAVILSFCVTLCLDLPTN